MREYNVLIRIKEEKKHNASDTLLKARQHNNCFSKHDTYQYMPIYKMFNKYSYEYNQ